MVRNGPKANKAGGADRGAGRCPFGEVGLMRRSVSGNLCEVRDGAERVPVGKGEAKSQGVRSHGALHANLHRGTASALGHVWVTLAAFRQVFVGALSHYL